VVPHLSRESLEEAAMIEKAGKIALVMVLGFITAAFCIVLWAVLEHGVQ
jgi:hypothetical protein